MNDGSHMAPMLQSPGHDIGPDEDRRQSISRDTPVVTNSEIGIIHDETGVAFEQLSNSTSSNPTWEEQLDETPANAPDPFYHEINRLETFKGMWEVDYPVHPEDLARNGFFYIGPRDKVKCVFCLMPLWNWVVGDTVEGEHQRHYPECPFVRGKCEHLNIPATNSFEDMKRSLGLNMKAKEDTIYELFANRLKSFKKWQNPGPLRFDALAEAGFYYLGTEDRVQCFSCKVVIRHWLPGDDPWFEHVKWSPQCQFLHSMKSSEFVRHIHEGLAQCENNIGTEASGELVVAGVDVPGAASVGEVRQHVHNTPEVRSLQPVDVQSANMDDDLRSPAVRAVMETFQVPMEQIRVQLEKIRLTKGTDHKITAEDFHDLI